MAGNDRIARNMERKEVAAGDMAAPMGLPNGPSQDVRISKAANGFIVTVGCLTFVTKNWKEVSEGLELYFKDENAARNKYLPQNYKRTR